MILRSYAKVNLCLYVLNKRPDTYHNLDSVFERINIFDTIGLTQTSGTAIRLATNSSQIPVDASNLAMRAAKLLQDTCQVKKGVRIVIQKNIPVGAGMGGGSSNAAAVLVGLNKLWTLRLSVKKLAELGAKIGADVPFFVYNTRFARIRGIGDLVEPVKALQKNTLWHVIVTPALHVPTPQIYKRWDSIKKARRALTLSQGNATLMVSALQKNNLVSIRTYLYNSLERVTIPLYPEIQRIKDRLARSGLGAVLMSGSGPTVFGIVSSRKEALFLSRQLKKERKWSVFAARSV
ncbi:MAG TPA: 4-(cytidine 5'-diphospho)-2-C-methyl-D-erythritol kinase [Candidatus Omnitrophota bacterium]|nr:4-(cytidine 5'-diphospho)-2-C-methyl-D-erythritol kinase [Candidatus Omnitrophota bacterium]HPT07216.1 4-(cytidine 5'-diphospho)-2-C-methyl-D-erythritol kinase [Candidatus Omnitrophota bacterium]